MGADEYNDRQLRNGQISPSDISEMARIAQRVLRLPADGMCGPDTLKALAQSRASRLPFQILPGIAITSGYMDGDKVDRQTIHPSWHYPNMLTLKGTPTAIVAHYTATDPGTGYPMAIRRQKPRQGTDRAASWHITIETDGTIIQMVSLLKGAWHVAKGHWNHEAIGIELVGHGDEFPEPQVVAACRVWRAIVQTYGIPRDRAMISHSSLDPARRKDPGPVWYNLHSERVLDHAYA